MKRWLPRTLFGQMALILLAGLLVSHLVGTLIFASDRARAVRAIGGYARPSASPTWPGWSMRHPRRGAPESLPRRATPRCW